MSETETRLQLPRLPRAQARAITATASLLGALDLSKVSAVVARLFGDHARVEGPWVESIFEPASACDERVIAIGFEERITSRRAVLEIEERLALALVDAALGESRALIPSGQGLRAIERGLLAFAVARELDASIPWLLSHTLVSRDEVLRLLEENVLLRASFLIHTGASSMRARLMLGARAEDSRPSALPSDVMLDLRLVIGRTTARLAEVNALDIGDFLVPTTLTLRVDGEGTIALTPLLEDSARVIMRREPNGLRVTRSSGTNLPLAQGKITMSDPSPLQDLSEAPVEIVLEAGRIRMPLSDLAKVCEGAILETQIALPPKVQLVVGDLPIALGELVEIEGELGVRITRVIERSRATR